MKKHSEQLNQQNDLINLSKNTDHGPEAHGQAAEELVVKDSGQWEIKKSNYGKRKDKDGKIVSEYKAENNARRKENNTGDSVGDVGPNKNVKAISTKTGQLSTRQQASLQQRLDRRKNRKQPVKIFSEEEKQRLASAMGVPVSERKTGK